MSKQCKKCGSKHEIQKHHILPQTFWGRRGNTKTIWLCAKCHQKVEYQYLAIESFFGKVRFGTRFQLKPRHYHRIMANYIPAKKLA
jgi:hypothetical protein